MTLNLKVIHWNHFSGQDMVKIDWDYDGSLVPPNRAITVKVTVTNLDLENHINISLDVIVFGYEI